MLDLLTALTEARILPVLEVPSADLAVPLAAALRAGGAGAIEITLRTDDALDAIRAAAAAADAADGLLVGAGTVLTGEDVEAAAVAGAAFAVSPGFDPEVHEACERAGLPWLPGAATATEVQACLRAGRRLVKVFPARQLGGPAGVRALFAPFAPRGARALPTGGVDADSARAYLDLPMVTAVGGSWMAPGDAVRERRWDLVTRLMADALPAGRA